MYCTGKRCPMQFGFDVKRCTLHNCSYRTKPITNADRIRAMSDDELANFLLNVAYAGSDPWAIPFARKFCDNCPTVEGTDPVTEFTMDFHECEFSDGKCPHGTDIVWWLQQPAEE